MINVHFIIDLRSSYHIPKPYYRGLAFGCYRGLYQCSVSFIGNQCFLCSLSLPLLLVLIIVHVIPRSFFFDFHPINSSFVPPRSRAHLLPRCTPVVSQSRTHLPPRCIPVVPQSRALTPTHLYTMSDSHPSRSNDEIHERFDQVSYITSYQCKLLV